MFETIEILELLGKIGATMNYRGYPMLLSILQIVDPASMTHFRITKDLYPVAAKLYDTNVRNVEHDLRHLFNHCWKYGDPETLRAICGEGRTRCPSNAEFIALLAAYLYRRRLRKADRAGIKAAGRATGQRDGPAATASSTSIKNPGR